MRNVTLPSIDDVSKNNPAVLLQPSKVLQIFNTEINKDKVLYRLNDNAIDEVMKFAKTKGWDLAVKSGHQILLTKIFN